MDEELLKRNTDCIYFLASPLTCKKGVECEYRHSEIARVNPRECWYWFSTGCFNLACAFRHPPLVHMEEGQEPDPSLVPCFYHFNSRCNKGDRCSFLHTTEFKAEALQSEKSDLNPSKTTEDLVVKNEVPIRADEPSDSIVSIEDEEISDGENRSLAYEEVEMIKREERWESSPGFDVIVEAREYDLVQNDPPEVYYRPVDDFGNVRSSVELGVGDQSGLDIRLRLGRVGGNRRRNRRKRAALVESPAEKRGFGDGGRRNQREGKRRGKKPRLMSEISTETRTFSGPKSLAQIKEEKRNAREKSDILKEK